MDIHNAEEFGHAIRLARKASGVTQQELAAASGIGIRFVRELEKGKVSCHLGKALNVASMLGLKISLAGSALTRGLEVERLAAVKAAKRKKSDTRDA